MLNRPAEPVPAVHEQERYLTSRPFTKAIRSVEAGVPVVELGAGDGIAERSNLFEVPDGHNPGTTDTVGLVLV